MEDSAAARAVMIGVSVFLSVSTISLVLLYYNTAKIAANGVGTGTDLEGNYTAQVLANVQAGNIVNSTEMINIINYYYGSKDTVINVDTSTLLVIGEEKNGDDIVYKQMNYNTALVNDFEINGQNSRLTKSGESRVTNFEQVNNNHLKYNVLTNVVLPHQKFKVSVGKDTAGRNVIRFTPVSINAGITLDSALSGANEDIRNDFYNSTTTIYNVTKFEESLKSQNIDETLISEAVTKFNNNLNNGVLNEESLKADLVDSGIDSSVLDTAIEDSKTSSTGSDTSENLESSEESGNLDSSEEDDYSDDEVSDED